MSKIIKVELEKPIADLLTKAAREISISQSRICTVEELASSYLSELLVDDANCQNADGTR